MHRARASSRVALCLLLLLAGPGRLAGAVDEQTAICVPDPTGLCLNDGRFHVAVEWRTAGGAGEGQAVGLTPDSGYFWFFGPGNVEVIVKVLDACAFNGHFWVFSTGLTNVEVTIRVTDTEAAQSKSYVNPLGTSFVPQFDTRAFDGCP